MLHRYVICHFLFKKTMPAKKRSTTKRSGSSKHNKSGVINSLVNNINAREKAGKSESKKDQPFERTIIKTCKIIGRGRVNDVIAGSWKLVELRRFVLHG
jgi:hypothetical protein